MIARRVLVLAALVLWSAPLAPVPACGPFFADAHHGFDEDPLVVRRFAELCQHLFWPDRPLLRGEDRQVLRALEDRQDWPGLVSAYRRALAAQDYLEDVRFLHDQLDGLPWVGTRISSAAWVRYRQAVRSATSAALIDLLPPPGSPVTDDPLPAFVDVSLALDALWAGQVDQAQSYLAQAKAWDRGGLKREEIAYLAAIAPAFAGIKQRDGLVAQPAAVVAGIHRWIEAHPQSPWREHAWGWLAYVLYHHREVPFGQDRDGLHAAVRIWQRQVTDPQAREGFDAAVDSLHLAYRRMRPETPAWMVADPRQAVALVWHAITDRNEDVAITAAVFAQVPLGALAGPGATLDGPTAFLLAQTWLRAGQADQALELARLAIARGHAEARFLAARLLAGKGDPAAAAALIAPAAGHALYAETMIRIGSVYEHQRQWMAALEAYLAAGSTLDILMLTDGEMPLPVLAQAVARTDLPRTGATDDGERPAGYDWRDELGRRLARRLIRHDRVAEALPLLAPALREPAGRLLAAQQAGLTGDPTTAPATAEQLWDLGMLWYQHGPNLLVNDRWWQQWRYTQGGISPTPCVPQAGFARSDFPTAPEDAGEPPRIRDEIHRMSAYERAYPLFLALADRFPDHPLAPRAVYQAALCRYWPCGTMPRLRTCPYWAGVATAEHYWAQGDALLIRLATTWPRHPLAQDPKVLAALARVTDRRPAGAPP